MKSIFTIVFLTLAFAGTANALATFSNGEKTDANAVNKNFVELNDKITKSNASISDLQSQMSALPQTYDAASYVTTATQKIFAISDTATTAEMTEYQTFGDYNGKRLMFRSRYAGANRLGVTTFTYSMNHGEWVWEQSQRLELTVIGTKYDPTTGPFVVAPPDSSEIMLTWDFGQPVLLMKKSMIVGQAWGGGVPVSMPPDLSLYGFNQVSALLGVEDVTLASVSVAGAPATSVTYHNCLKISDQRITSAINLGNWFQRISWYCPNGVGLVKRISIFPTADPNAVTESMIFELTTIR